MTSHVHETSEITAALERVQDCAPDHTGAHPDPKLCLGCRFDAALATIEAHIAEIERERDEVERNYDEHLSKRMDELEAAERDKAEFAADWRSAVLRAEAAEAALEERTRERDGERMRVRFLEQVVKEAEADLLLAAQQNTRLSERLDRLEAALREAADELDLWASEDAAVASRALASTLRAALAEEPYADVPGAGQRGC